MTYTATHADGTPCPRANATHDCERSHLWTPNLAEKVETLLILAAQGYGHDLIARHLAEYATSGGTDMPALIAAMTDAWSEALTRKANALTLEAFNATPKA